MCMKQQFITGGKTISVYPSAGSDMPVVYLNTFSEEGDSVYQLLQNMSCADFTLVAISNLTWNHDMSPWDIPPISKGDTPCTGGADDYMKLLTEEIVPKAEEYVQGKPLWRGLAGYSLAGLFAVYSVYRTEIFSRIASISGSLWFPGIMEYVLSHEMKNSPEHLYFSIGDRECRTSNSYLQAVQKNTEELEAYYKGKGVDTVFQLNEGNHFKNAAKRTAAGIMWLLDKQ